MAAPIKSVVLCSPTGKLGPFLLSALQSEGFVVTVILRSSSTATFPSTQNINIIRTSDAYKYRELVSAFQGHDAVVLCLNFELLSLARRFAEASIEAGNRWFIASTYAGNLEDPRCELFPASVPHKKAVEELRELQKGQEGSSANGSEWGWSSISCGPWTELSIAAGAWNIDPQRKTAELIGSGDHVFTTSTRKQVALAVARILKQQPASARNKSVYIASFEISMATWLDAYKEVMGRDGWTETNIDAEDVIQRSQDQFAKGEFQKGYMGLALAVCTGSGFENRFSEFTELSNEELGLPRENLIEVLKEGLALPNPFAA